jgi:hypothetical protein
VKQVPGFANECVVERLTSSCGESIRAAVGYGPITTFVFSDADHGMYEFETLPDGERISTRQPAGHQASSLRKYGDNKSRSGM